jgi:hypothetical protein
MSSTGEGSSTGWVSLTPVPGGTRVDLTCQYESSYGGDHQYTYAVVVYSTDGLKERLPEFTAEAGKEVRTTAETAFELDEIEKVTVENSYGPILQLIPDRTP